MSIFRRMFNRKDNRGRISASSTTTTKSRSGNNITRLSSSSFGSSTTLDSTSINSSSNNNNNNNNNNKNNYRQTIKHDNESNINKFIGNSIPNSPGKSIRRDEKRTQSVLQLTPLWEHIINTRTLPDTIDPKTMFDEFVERLQDPEWQVRQHALRVLVDVLLVIGNKADIYFNLLLPHLIENLGHSAPTVRKGALDCLRVYLTETSMPESIIIQILDIGLNQAIINEPFGGRLTCGVMLSLPSLVQATMGSTKRNFILKTTIDTLIKKMTQIIHQEITLKVLLKFKELLGDEEFTQFVTAADYREFQLLCSVYDITGSNHFNYQSNGADFKKSWQIIPSFDKDEKDFMYMSDLLLKSSDDESSKTIDLALNDTQPTYSFTSVAPSDIKNHNEPKVILETEIKINNDTVTMRILEARDDSFIEDYKFEEKPLGLSSNELMKPIIKEDLSNCEENAGLVQVLTDSELDEINKTAKPPDPNVLGTPKRVTFGGEIVKMRTPDSDGTTVTSDIDVIDLSQIRSDNNFNTTQNMVIKSQSMQELSNNQLFSKNKNSFDLPIRAEKITSAFELEGNSATKQVGNQKADKLPSNETQNETKDNINNGDNERLRPSSPTSSSFKQIPTNPVEKILSPRIPHKEIEVLHNLQRDISPNRPIKEFKPKNIDIGKSENNLQTPAKEQEDVDSKSENIKVKSWEDLGLVDKQILQNLRSGDWQRRSYAIEMIEEALKPPDNLVLVQPYLESLLRTFLLSERHAAVIEEKTKVLMNLISRLPLDNLEKRTGQILTGLCRQGGANSNRIAKLLMQRLSPAAIVLKLLSNEFLYTRSSKFRGNALQIVMYALMTFPSTSFDTSTCVIGATYAALDSKKRVRQAALDILAILGQTATPRIVIEIIERVIDVRNSVGKEKFDNSTVNTTDFISAVKARLSRKQLPNITADDSVVYALRIPSPSISNNLEYTNKFPADLKWIASGIGSVSPTSMKKRAQKFNRQQSYAPESTPIYRNSKDIELKKSFYTQHEGQNHGGNSNGFTQNEERNYRFKELPATNHGGKYLNEYRDDIIGTNNRRNVFVKSFSDSSQDERSSDSIYKTYERVFKNSINSRFPSMEKKEINVNQKDDHSYYNRYNTNNYVSFNRGTKFVPKKFNKIYNHSQPSVLMIGENSTDSTFSSSFEKRSYVPRRFSSFEKLYSSNKPPQEPYIISNNVYKTTIVEDMNTKQENQTFTDHQNSPKHSIHSKSKQSTPIASITQKSPAISTISREFPITRSTENLEIINFENEEFTESSELSSDDKLNSSGHSTPTRVLVERMTPFNSTPLHQSPQKQSPEKKSPEKKSPEKKTSPILQKVESNEVIKNKSATSSAKSRKSLRPQSSFSHKSHKSFFIEDEFDVIDLTEAIYTMQTSTETDTVDGTTNDFEIFQNNETRESTISPFKDLKSDENSLDTKSIGTESRTETEQFSIETVIMTNLKEDDVQSHTVIEVEMKDIELENGNADDLKIEENNTKPKSPVPLNLEKPSIFSTQLRTNDFVHAEEDIKDSEIDMRSNTSTETSSEYLQSAESADFLLNHQQNFSPIKSVVKKSKTTVFSRKNRRVSPVKQSIKYSKIELYPQSLKKFEKPKEALAHTFHQLESPTWEVVMDGLVDIVKLIRHHPEILEPHCHLVCMHLAKSVKNLRSQVSRAACQATTEYFTIRSKNIEQECDDLVGNLLNRTADTNRFLRADTGRALDSMCDNLPIPKVLHLLVTRGVGHQNAIVRTASAKLMNRLIERIGCDKVYQLPREHKEKIFVTACTLLMEGSLETRSYAKALLKSLSNHPLYNKSILEYIPPRIYRNIEKSLKNIKS